MNKLLNPIIGNEMIKKKIEEDNAKINKLYDCNFKKVYGRINIIKNIHNKQFEKQKLLKKQIKNIKL